MAAVVGLGRTALGFFISNVPMLENADDGLRQEVTLSFVQEGYSVEEIQGAIEEYEGEGNELIDSLFCLDRIRDILEALENAK